MTERTPLALAAGLLLLASPVAAQEQSKAQQRCINELHKRLAGVAKAQRNDAAACVKDASRGKLDGLTLEECTTADRQGKVAKARTKALAGEAKRCREVPSFGYTGGASAMS